MVPRSTQDRERTDIARGRTTRPTTKGLRLLSFELAAQARLGALIGDDTVVDLNRSYAYYAQVRGIPDPFSAAGVALPPEMLQFLRLGSRGLEAARAVIDFVDGLDPELIRFHQLRTALSMVKLLPPVPRPGKVVCVARNYSAHAKEAGRDLSEIPILFARFPQTLIAAGDPIVRPVISDQLDWEGELAVVIGAGGRAIPRSGALAHVAGYSIFNDVTVRDFQFRTPQYTAGKNFNSSGPFGPVLALVDEVQNPAQLELTTEINGERVQHGHTGDMLFDVATIVSHVSEFIELEPGDVIAMGTPSGVGFTRTPPRFLRPGDSVSVSITGLGTLTNPVIDEEVQT